MAWVFFFQKKKKLPKDPAIPLLAYFQRGNKVVISEKCQHAHAHPALLAVAETRKSPESPPTREDKKQHMGNTTELQKGEGSPAGRNSGGTVVGIMPSEMARARETNAA